MSEPATNVFGLIIADGDILVRVALADYLRSCGYRVIEASSSDEVMTLLTHGEAGVSCLLADADLQGALNGFGLRHWVREHHPQISVILAGNIEAAARAAGQLCEEGPHLARPYDHQLVVDHIKRLAARAGR